MTRVGLVSVLVLCACTPPGHAAGHDGGCRGCEDGSGDGDGPGSEGTDGTGDASSGGGSGSGDGGMEPPCCEEDNFVYRSVGSGDEVVAVAFDGTHAYTCGGFGVRVDDVVTDPDLPDFLGSAASRCQNIGIGPIADPGQVFWLAHHGDTWIEAPFLGTYHLPAGGPIEEVDVISEPGRLYEGLAWADDHLYVTLHNDGLAVYATDAVGIPTPLATLGGFDNAVEIALSGTRAYVADGAGGLKVVDITQPETPSITHTVPTAGLARHAAIDGERLFVALGGDGVAAFELADPDDPLLVGTIDTAGSAQAVAVDDDLVAVAAWNHTAVYDANTLALLATERVKPYPGFEQDLGVAMNGNFVYTGEWESLHVLEYRPGVLSPDAWIATEIFSFDPKVEDDRVVLLENRGQRDLVVAAISVEDNAYWVDAKLPMTVAPGEKKAFEIGLDPPAKDAVSALHLATNDPDDYHADYQVPLAAISTDQLDVGDSLTSDFDFLDPGGVSGLEGQVVVLAYFALF